MYMKTNKFFNKNTVQKIMLIILSLVIAFLVEIFIFHASYWDQVPKDVDRKELNSFLVSNASISVEDEDIYFPEGKGEIEFLDIFQETKNISFMIKGFEECTKGYVLLRDDGNVYGWIQANTFQIYPTEDAREVQLELRSKGEIRDIQIILENGKGCMISDVVINDDVSIHILWIRVFILFLLTSLLIGIIKFNWLKTTYDSESKVQLGITFIVMSACIWFAVNIFQGYYSDAVAWEYPLTENEVANKVEYHTPDVQMFDALMKRISHVDQYPSAELKELDNPYDISERHSKGTPYWWDATYYKDNYYFYFGQSSIFIVTFPYYLITGKVPCEKTTLLILSIISIIGMFFMIRQFFRKFKVHASYILYVFFNCAVVFGSLTYYLLKAGSLYSLTISTAIACMTWSIGLAYAAVCDKNKITRRMLFFLSGVFCVLLVESRPSSLILEIGAIAPLFISILINRDRKIKSRVIDASSFLFPVVLGAGVIMYYNYIRFDNLFEFGLTYQLTVRDVSYDTFTFSPKKIINAIYYYFFRPYYFTSDFPYLVIRDSGIETNGNFIYNSPIVGIFASFPIAWGVFAVPFIKEKTKKLEKITYISMLSSALILAIFDYIKSGLLERYLSEISLIIIFVAGMALIHKIKLEEKWSSILFIMLTLSTVVFGILLVIALDPIINFQPENINYLLKLRELFSIS